MSKTLSIFGVTGSIGESAQQIVDLHADDFAIDTLSANANWVKLAELAIKYQAKAVVIGDERHFQNLRDALPKTIEVHAGAGAIAELAARPVDICLNAIVGAAGLPVSFGATKAAKILALANKESLVCAGQALIVACELGGTQIIPVDSEHSAIFQALQGQDRSALEKIILTASGGPFRTWSHEQMKTARLQDALQHPNWDMGSRITIDSASMFNKALEMIEAQQLFGVSGSQIEVLIHPQSIVHSLVEFSDGGQLAQLGVPDMRHAISYAMHYPRRVPSGVERLDLAQVATLNFEAPDETRFPALRIAREVMAANGCEGAAMNAAKEIALDGFIAGQINFLQMAELVEKVLTLGGWNTFPSSLSIVLEADYEARTHAQELMSKIQ